MAATKGQRNEANTVLIVFLILFVITTIGLGVSTYTGYDADGSKDAAIAQEKLNAQAIEYERDWYKFCSLVFLNYTGELQGEAMAEEVKEFAILNDKFVMKRNEQGQLYGSGNLPDTKMKEQPKILPKATVERLLTKLETTFPYKDVNGILTLGDMSLAKAIQDAKDRYKTKDNETRASLLCANKENTNAAKAEADLAAAKKVYDEQVAAQQKRVQDELVKYQNQFKELVDNNKKLSDALIAAGEKSQKEMDAASEKIKKLEDSNKQLDQVVKETEKKLITKQEEEKQSTEYTRKVPTDIRIVQIDTRGQVGYINVGSADHVTPQLTFSVFGLTPDGRVENNNKATIEVVNVVDAHLSEVRVTGLRARRLDGSIAVMSPTELVSGRDKVLVPVARNDVIYNAAWHPAIQRHVAIAGIVDLNGDPRNAMTDFRRFLEKQNMVVDAYIDMRGLEIRGKITVQTDYLIMGGGADILADGTKADDQKKLTDQIEEMRRVARNNGVEVINVKCFLDVIGYRLPTTTLGSLSGNYRYSGVGGAADAPADKPADKPPVDPKPADPKP